MPSMLERKNLARRTSDRVCCTERICPSSKQTLNWLNRSYYLMWTFSKGELERAGFTVGTIGYESRYLCTKETQNDGRGRVGAIAGKPL
ncbi:hypothetical protein RvY_16642-2 [Ramazzottius varieornatus]|uniref:Uncharacterized protein n=1 Tax=Ramazzottius varieornatus TaxID=947166 RepID=A0A1D1VZ84_RAMVA|nr:hypothetical protein RvY_16642-2 [Ramazzottius varieornatus]